MAEKVQRIVNLINQIASPRLAEKWDNVGLLVGDYAAEVDRVMVSLDVTEAVLDEAIANGVQLIIAHHPMIFSELKNIRADQPTGRLVMKAIQNGINIFAAHTNLDIAWGGINDLLAERLELTEVQPLTDISKESLYKIVVFVPAGYEEQVRNALSEAGAGWIGNYSHCTYQSSGVGTFKPLEGTDPFIGKVGELEKVKESRIETIISQSNLNRAIRAMTRSHPYEEVAYDLYPLLNQGEETGLGRIGYLAEPKPYQEVIPMVKEALDLPYLRYLGDPEQMIRKVAVLGGSGKSYIKAAAFRGADLYISGDIGLHDGQLADRLGLALIDAGHYGTEKICVPYLTNILTEQVATDKMSVEVIESTIKTDPFELYK